MLCDQAWLAVTGGQPSSLTPSRESHFFLDLALCTETVLYIVHGAHALKKSLQASSLPLSLGLGFGLSLSHAEPIQNTHV